MRNLRFILLTVLCCQARVGFAKSDAITAEDAIAQAEDALDAGRVGDAQKIAAKLLKTHGLDKALAERADIIQARTSLLLGQYPNSEKIFARIHKRTPDDAKVSEWYARALEGDGKGDAALDMFKQVLAKQELTDGDSYWILAQLERDHGDKKAALLHAETARKKPIVMQSAELDAAMDTFIRDLRSAK